MAWYSAILTTRQREVAEEFEERARTGRPPPTHRELCAIFGWSSSATARDCLRSLVRKEVLTREPGKARGYRLVEPRMARIPLRGSVAAGAPAPASEERGELVGVPESWLAWGAAFALTVRGDSMRDAGIMEGDVVAVQPDSEPRPGNIVAVTLNGETTLKWLERDSCGRYWLRADNLAYRPIAIATPDTTIHGIVVGVQRGYRPIAERGAR